MAKKYIRNLARQFGYDIVKTSKFAYGKKNKRRSSDPRFDYYETSNGNYFLPKNCNGDIVANAIKTGRLFDGPILEIAKQYVQPNSIILDLGANYGQMAIEFSKLAKGTKVFAFEAQAMVFAILEKNIALHKATNITPFFNAVFDTDDVELFFPTPDLVQFPSYGSYGLDLQAKAGQVVRTISIDSIPFDLPVSFMKIDIQGSDLAAMKGARNTIARYKMPIIFEYEEQFQQSFGTSFQDYVDFVNSIGYKFVKTVQDINYLIVPA